MGFTIWPLVITAGIGSLVVYFIFNRIGKKKEEEEEMPPYDDIVEMGPPKLTNEQYEKFGQPYGISYDNYLITGALPIRPSDTTSIAPFSQEHIFYYPEHRLPSFLSPATYLRVQPPKIPNAPPWNYTNYYSQF